jgi:hypothetical protein
MQLTSDHFRQANTIVFEAPILHHAVVSAAGVNPNNADMSFRDVVDLKGNGQVPVHFRDYDNQLIYPKRDVILDDPQLDKPYSDIKRAAGDQGTEVVLASDLGNLDVTYPGVRLLFKDKAWHGQGHFVDTQSTMNQVTDDILATVKGGVGATWAFDCKANSLVLFVPKPAPPPAE